MLNRLISVPSNKGVSTKGETLKEISLLEILLKLSREMLWVEMVRCVPTVKLNTPAYRLFAKIAKLHPSEPETKNIF